MAKPTGKLTIVLETDARKEVARWAAEEGRPVSNLVRRLLQAAIERRRVEHRQQAAA